MTENEVINRIEIKERTYICPVCGYTDGFHVSFKLEGEKTKNILICPECHARFDPGWVVEIRE